MAKTTAWIVTIIGLLMVPPVKDWFDGMSSSLWMWVMAVLILAVGVTKLMRNYKKR